MTVVKGRKTIRGSFDFSTLPKPIIENRFEQLHIGKNHAEVRSFLRDKDNEEPLKALKTFDPDFNPNYHNKGNLKKMKQD
eukprot:15358399-Ditylum_brightwellii.AAC.1